jgi:CPA1 family monovalent cation:H+ antiporter
LFTTPYVIRVLDRRTQQRERRVGPRPRVVSGLAGFRGAVSLAAALGVPAALSSGQPFPDRDLIIFVTTGVIVITLVVPALILPAVVRWAQLPPDTAVAEERQLAETLATEEALAALPQLADERDTDPAITARLRREYEKHLAVLGAGDGDAGHQAALSYERQDVALRAALIAHKRATVLRLRDEGRIDDTVLRRLQTQLDLEDLRLAGPSAPE